MLGVNPKDDNETVSGENIVLMIDAGGDEGALDKEEFDTVKCLTNNKKLPKALDEQMFVCYNTSEKICLQVFSSAVFQRKRQFDKGKAWQR